MKNRSQISRQLLVLTPGDPAGIGPEITWKMIKKFHGKKALSILCIGAEAPFKRLRAPIVYFDPNHPDFSPPKRPKNPKRNGPFVWLWPAPVSIPEGKGTHLEGYQSGWSIEKAVELIHSEKATALVTGPISKERLQLGGYPYPGHTEFLAALCDAYSKSQPTRIPTHIPTHTPTMMLANTQLRVTLVTTHLGVHQISTSLTREHIRRAVLQTAQGLQEFWKIKKPKIAVTALNPHGGEKGLFGKEEIEIIEPEIRALSTRKDFELSGPFPADTLFAKHILTPENRRFDAVVCMYHDQGLIPVKLLDFHHTVNVTLGLPIIRTSVDHGVGFDIVGKGVADPSSLCAAVELATRFIQLRLMANHLATTKKR